MHGGVVRYQRQLLLVQLRGLAVREKTAAHRSIVQQMLRHLLLVVKVLHHLLLIYIHRIVLGCSSWLLNELLLV